jgi:hypothetical protein
MNSGDRTSISSMYESTRNFLFNTYKPGKKNQWSDWGKEIKDIAVIENSFFYIDLTTLKKIALLSGHSADISAVNTKLDSIRNNFNKQFWKGNYYMSSQVNTPDNRANAMAMNAGLTEPEKWEAIKNNVLLKVRNSSSFLIGGFLKRFVKWVKKKMLY